MKIFAPRGQTQGSPVGESTPRGPGLSPGSLIHVGERRSESSALRLIRYDDATHEVQEHLTVDELPATFDPKQVSWIHFSGLHDVDTLSALGARFGIDALLLEDILHTESRAKIESGPHSVFVILNSLCSREDHQHIDVQHFALVLLPGNVVLSFLEGPSPVFDPVLSRLKSGGGGRIRKGNADYLTWALLDSLVDHYLHTLDDVENRLDSLDDRLQADAENVSASELYTAKRECSALLRLMKPVVDIGNTLITADSPLLNERSRPYFRDLADHTHQVRDALESIRDQAASLRDFHLSAVSNRMNEVMKVLTCFASIFLPLTFLAGIYGMNFDHIPELHYKWAYPALWVVFVLTFLGMLAFFRKRKWL